MFLFIISGMKRDVCRHLTIRMRDHDESFSWTCSLCSVEPDVISLPSPDRESTRYSFALAQVSQPDLTADFVAMETDETMSHIDLSRIAICVWL